MEEIKKILGWVYAGVLLVLGGLVYYFRSQLETTKSKLARQEAKDKLAQVLADKSAAAKESDDAEKEYLEYRNKFLADITKRDDE